MISNIYIINFSKIIIFKNFSLKKAKFDKFYQNLN